MSSFDHDKLIVYQKALDFVILAREIIDKIPPRQKAIREQLERGALSIPLNIAEGAGEFARREKARFYRIARRSATECAAILDVAQRLPVSSEVPISAARKLLISIVSILIRMARNLEGDSA